MAFTMPGMFWQAQRRWTSHRHNEPSKGGLECRPGDCPCENYGRSYASAFELKLGYQQIGRSCSIGVSTVHKYLKRAEAAGLSWPSSGVFYLILRARGIARWFGFGITPGTSGPAGSLPASV